MRQPRDWGSPCPNPECPLYKRRQKGNVSAISPYRTHRGKRRSVRCPQCAQCFSETRDTVFFDLRTPAEKVMMALTMRLVRVDLAGLGFVLGVTAAPVVAGRRRGAQQAEAIHHHRLRPLPVTQGQLDERWSVSERPPARETDEAGASWPGGEAGRPWVWVSFAPACRLMIAAVVGPRTLDPAKEVGAATQARVAGLPACCSDGCTGSRAALLAAFHVVPTFARTGKRGRPRQPVGAPHPHPLYGQLVQQQQPGTLLTLSTRVVLGAERLTHLGLTISTALGERVPVTLRQAWAPLSRKTSSCGKDRERLRQRVVCLHAFDNVARPHRSWRQPLPLHERTCHGAICPRWRARTPAMAAGLTDHGWTLRALLTATFEPLDSQSISG